MNFKINVAQTLSALHLLDNHFKNSRLSAAAAEFTGIASDWISFEEEEAETEESSSGDDEGDLIEGVKTQMTMSNRHEIISTSDSTYRKLMKKTKKFGSMVAFRPPTSLPRSLVKRVQRVGRNIRYIRRTIDHIRQDEDVRFNS